MKRKNASIYRSVCKYFSEVLPLLARRISLLFVVFGMAAFDPLFAEQLAVKNFSTAEGLARNLVSVIRSDSRGYVWIGTADGLSRFDGYEFRNYNIDQGLPHPVISDIIEGGDGIYWVATHKGLCRINFAAPLDENGRLQMEIFHLGAAKSNDIIFDLHLDKRGILWAGTQDGLYRISEIIEGGYSVERISIDPKNDGKSEGIGGLAEDERGNLWLTTRDGLICLNSDDKISRYEINPQNYLDRFGNMVFDARGRLWMSGVSGLYILKPPTSEGKIERVAHRAGEIILPDEAGQLVVYDEKDGLLDKQITSVFRASDDQIWVGTRRGLSIFKGDEFQNFTLENGLLSDEILCFGEDFTGNIWLGTESTGAMRVARNGFATFTKADGLLSNRISSVFEGSDGELYVSDGGKNISRFDGRQFVTVEPNFPKKITKLGWSWQQPVLQDDRGEWWMATGQGLVRFPAVGRIEELSRVAPLAVYDETNGLAGREIIRLYEDGRGDIWISNFSPPASGVARFERRTGKIFQYSSGGHQIQKNSAAYSFAEDNFGNLWLGFNGGGLARYRNGRIEMLEDIENLPETNIYDMLLDGRGNLWLATGAGAYYMENLADEKPKFTRLTKEQGLTTNDIIAITDDLDGRIYLATSQGVHRYDPSNGQIELFTTADGIANSELRTAMRDKNGDLWFGTIRGLTRFEPRKFSRNETPPPILITSIRIGDKNFPLGELGETEIGGIELAPNQNSIEIEFIGLFLQSGDILQYQYKLKRDDEWSKPNTDRRLVLADLKPGDYTFQVRAISAKGLISENVGTVSFNALAPFYLRWWFLAGIISLICGAAYAIYRYRLQKLLEVARIRLRIATDLHDDIGSSLSQISLISEVLANKRGGFNREEKRSLRTIAETSRSAVGSMSEMVWAINPKRDNLPDLIFRMRRFAADTLTAAEIDFTFRAPDIAENAKIDVDARRQIYLIFKEALNNAVKHSECRHIEITFIARGSQINLSVRDDGRGFEENLGSAGNGIENMRERTEKIGGKLKITTERDAGTTVNLEFPQ